MKNTDRMKAKTLIRKGKTDIHKVLKPDPLKTGFTDLDDKTGGLFPGELVCIAGRRYMGTTGFAISIINRVCIRDKKNCLYFALAEDGRGILSRLVTNVSQKMAVFRPEYEKLFIRTLKEIERSPLYINETAYLIGTIEKTCKRLNQKAALDLVVIDYFQLVKGKKDDRSLISVRLKQLARSIGCPIMVLCQLNQSVDLREERRPKLSDLKDIGEMNHYADKVLFLYRDDYYDHSADNKGIIEAIVAKNTHSYGVGKVEMSYTDGGLIGDIPRQDRARRHS